MAFKNILDVDFNSKSCLNAFLMRCSLNFVFLSSIPFLAALLPAVSSAFLAIPERSLWKKIHKWLKCWDNWLKKCKFVNLMRHLSFYSSKILFGCLFQFQIFHWHFAFQQIEKWHLKGKFKIEKRQQNKIFELQKNKLRIKFALFRRIFHSKLKFEFMMFYIGGFLSPSAWMAATEPAKTANNLYIILLT